MPSYADRDGSRWTETDVLDLEKRWTRFSLDAIARALRRSPASVVAKAAKLRLGGCRRGHKTIADVARETGYTVVKIMGAVRRAGLVLPRIPSTTAVRHWRPRRGLLFHLDAEHEGLLLEALRAEPDDLRRIRPRRSAAEIWSGKPGGACAGCGTTERPHASLGRCEACYRSPAQRGGDDRARAAQRAAYAIRRRAPAATWRASGTPDGCSDCGTTARPHLARGRCRRCYQRWTLREGPQASADGRRRREVDRSGALRAAFDARGCPTCGRTGVRYGRRGLCGGCYNRGIDPQRALSRRGLPVDAPERVALARAAWARRGAPGCTSCGCDDRPPYAGLVCQRCRGRSGRAQVVQTALATGAIATIHETEAA